MIRFAEESVELQDICQFRTELDVLPGFEQLPFYLDLELHFYDLAFTGGPEFIYDQASKVAFLLILIECHQSKLIVKTDFAITQSVSRLI